jgi:hypothetical protein
MTRKSRNVAIFFTFSRGEGQFQPAVSFVGALARHPHDHPTAATSWSSVTD